MESLIICAVISSCKLWHANGMLCQHVSFQDELFAASDLVM